MEDSVGATSVNDRDSVDELITVYNLLYSEKNHHCYFLLQSLEDGQSKVVSVAD